MPAAWARVVVRSEAALSQPSVLVILREGGGSSTPRPLGLITAVSGILDHPPARVMTIVAVRNHAFAISRRVSPEVCPSTSRPLKFEGAGKAGCALHPRSRVQSSGRRRRTRAYRFSGNIRLSLRGSLRLIRDLLGEPCPLATVVRAALSGELDTSPWGVGTTRFRHPLQAPSSVAPSTSTASPPRAGTLRNAPLEWDGMRRDIN